MGRWPYAWFLSQAVGPSTWRHVTRVCGGLGLLIVALTRCAGRDAERPLPAAAKHAGPEPPYLSVTALHASDTSRIGWYGNALAAMGEPRLETNAGTPTLRFLWLRTFHRAMAVRLEQRSTGCLVVLTILNGRAGTELGSIYKRDSSITGSDRCTQVRNTLDAAGFARTDLAADERGRDGAEWVFEARDASGYRAVVRWSPELSTTNRGFAMAGRAFLDLAAWDQAADDPIY